MGIDGDRGDAEFTDNLLWSQAPGKSLKYSQLSRSSFADNFSTAGAFLSIHLHALLFLRGAEGLVSIVNVGSQCDKLALNQFDSCVGWCMHDGPFVGLLPESIGSMNMPDVVMAVEIERGDRDSQQRHQAATAADGEVNAIALALQVTDEPVNGIKRAI